MKPIITFLAILRLALAAPAPAPQGFRPFLPGFPPLPPPLAPTTTTTSTAPYASSAARVRREGEQFPTPRVSIPAGIIFPIPTLRPSILSIQQTVPNLIPSTTPPQDRQSSLGPLPSLRPVPRPVIPPFGDENPFTGDEELLNPIAQPRPLVSAAQPFPFASEPAAAAAAAAAARVSSVVAAYSGLAEIEASEISALVSAFGAAAAAPTNTVTGLSEILRGGPGPVIPSGTAALPVPLASLGGTGGGSSGSGSLGRGPTVPFAGTIGTTGGGNLRGSGVVAPIALIPVPVTGAGTSTNGILRGPGSAFPVPAEGEGDEENEERAEQFDGHTSPSSQSADYGGYFDPAEAGRDDGPPDFFGEE